MSLDSVEVGNIVLSDEGRLDFLERQVANLMKRVAALEKEASCPKKRPEKEGGG